MDDSIYARAACAIIALTVTAMSFGQIMTVDAIDFEGEGTSRPALYA